MLVMLVIVVPGLVIAGTAAKASKEKLNTRWDRDSCEKEALVQISLSSARQHQGYS